MTLSDEFHKVIERLEQERDELRVRLNLASHEVRDEWEEVEERWRTVQRKLEGLREEAESAGRDARTALEIAVDDLKRHLAKMREKL